jgi:valyl-tRNA synthetase
MVNWDPQGKTAVSDEEVIHKDVQAKLFHIQYPLVDGSGSVTIATTRPETIMADAAICVNPADERYVHLHGKKVRIPLIDREISIIADEYVTLDFGTGCLKVTPAHDLNDYELGLKHKLPVIDILSDDGTLNEKAILFVGVDRFEARKRIVKQLTEEGYLTKTDEYKSTVGTSERTGAVIEPKLSLQWFMKMEEMAKPALDNVMNDNIQLHPAKFKNTYRSWMENVRDWCISRQLWWGQQIPAFYLEDGTLIVAKDKKEALRIARDKYQLYALVEDDLTQDPDVLDTWFSSWLWPISVFDGIENPDNEEIKYYYPTNDLVTGPDILFFWVARMIMAGYEWRGELPFKNVYLTGIVRDKQGRKMSKSLGNSPDPLELIERFGADGVRSGLLFSAPAGNDLLFDDKLCEQGRNFSNKIWNAFRLLRGLEVVPGSSLPEHVLATAWFESKLNQTIVDVQDHFSKFRISDALLSIYELVWDDFCGKYLEIIKPAYQSPIHSATLNAALGLFDSLMRLMHPYMPFITEEIWQAIDTRAEKESICKAEFPRAGVVNAALIAQFDVVFEVVTKIREIRNSKQLSPKLALALCIKADNTAAYAPVEAIMMKLANLESITFVADAVADAQTFVVKADQFFVPLADDEDPAVVKAESEKELVYLLGFKKSVEAKLANEKFVANAKADLVERERQKLADTETKIQSLQELLARLG